MNTKDQITIIGPGKVGLALKKALKVAGFQSISMVGKGEKVESPAKWIIITTPDAQITHVGSSLADLSLKDTFVIHVSGTHSSEILAPLTATGAEVGCMHPIQSVTETTKDFRDSWFDIEGSQTVLNELEKLAGYLGANTIRVTAEQKKLLHISAVMASNYLVTLAHLATEIAASDLEEDHVRKAILPLMASVLENLKTLSPEQALTGPIQRGDTETVKEHLALLTSDEKLRSIYKHLGLLTLELTDHEQDIEQALNQFLK